MHNLKKVVAVIAVLAMVLGTMVTGFAATVTPAKVGSDVAGTDYETAATELAALGIMTGYPDGTFKPGNQITRAEFATLVVRALGLESAAKLTTAKPAFSDVNADYQWAWGYITVATENGIIKGYPDGTFGPAKPVTYAEAVAMLVRALGYEPAVTGTWPVGYLSKGSELGITDDVKVSADGYANRGDVAVMLDNALDIDMMEQTGYGTDISYEVKEGKTLLSDKLKVDEYEDYVVTATPKVDSSLDDDEIKMVDENGKNEDTYTVAAGINPDDLLGLKVTAWEKDDKIVYVKYDTAQVKTDVVGEDATEDSVYLYVADDTYDFAKDAVVYINNDSADPEDLKTGMYGRFIFEDGDVRFADVYELTQTNMVVTAVNKDDKTIDYIDSDGSKSTLDLTNADEGYKIFLDGKTIDLSDVKADDVISYADIDGDWYYLFVTRNAVEGKLTKVKDTTFYIDETDYSTSAGNLNGVTVYTLNNGDDYYDYDGTDATIFDDAVGEDVKILLDNVGEVAFLTTDVKVTSDEIYGVLEAVNTFADEVKIYANGEKKTYDFDGDVYYVDGDTTGDLDNIPSISGADDYIPVMFKTDKDGVITELYLLDVPEVADAVGVKLTPNDGLNSFDDDEDTIMTDDKKVYYVESDTVILDSLDDPDTVVWDDIKSQNPGDAEAMIYVDSRNRVKFMIFTDGYDTIASDTYYGVVLDYYYDGDWKIDVDEYDTGKVTYEVDKNTNLKKGVMIKYTVDSDKKAHPTIVASRNVAKAGLDINGTVASRDGAYLTVGDTTYKFNSSSVVYEVKLNDDGSYDSLVASSYTKILKGYTVYGVLDENNVIAALLYMKPVTTKDTEKPVISDISVDGKDVASDNTVTIVKGSAGDTMPVKVKITDNVGVTSVTIGSGTVSGPDSDGFYTATLSKPSTEGTYYITITAKDAAGNTQTVKVTVTVVATNPEL